MVHDDDAVRHPGAAEAMADQDDRSAGTDLAELGLERGFGPRVEGGGRLVQDQHPGVPQGPGFAGGELRAEIILQDGGMASTSFLTGA